MALSRLWMNQVEIYELDFYASVLTEGPVSPRAPAGPATPAGP